MAIERLLTGNTKPSPKNTAPVYAEDINPIIDKVNDLESTVATLESNISTLPTEVGVPYTGATQPVNLGIYSLGTDEIKTDATTPTDLLLTTGAGKTVVFGTVTYRDEYPAILVAAGGAKAPDETAHTIGGVKRTMKSFDGSATEEVISGSFEIPHDYMIGQPIELHVHWRPSTSGLGSVIWYFDWEYSPPESQAQSQTVKTASRTLVADRQYYHLLDTFGNLPQPSTPFNLGGKIGFNLRRTPTTDTYGADVLLEQIALHIPCDTNGSRGIYTK